MSEVTNSDLLKVLLEMKEDVGELKSTAASQARAFAQHIQDDAIMARAVNELRLAAAGRKGAAGVWMLIYSVVSGALVEAFHYFSKH